MTEHHLTFGHVVRSEWTKLISLRSSWIMLGGLPLAGIGLAALIGWNDRDRPTPSTVTEAVGGGFLLYAMAIGVFGLLAMTGEHGSGLIRATLIAVPRRLPVLGAKALVLLATTLPVLAEAYVGSFLAHQAFADPAIRLSLTDPQVVRSIIGATAATVAAGLIGLGIGTMLRGTAGAVTTFVAGLVILPPVLLGALPDALRQAVLPLLPTPAMQGLFAVGAANTPVLDPGASTIVVLGWVVVILGGAAAVMHRMDV